MKKVYCGSCMHIQGSVYGINFDCYHPENHKRVIDKAYAWLTKTHKHIFIAKPQDRNKNNDCPGYKYKKKQLNFLNKI